MTRDRIEALLRKMAATKIVVVGDAMLDVYLVGEVDRVSPEAPVPVVTVHASRQALGGAANVAANVAAMGAECRLVAVVGTDARGEAVRTELSDERLSIDYLVTDGGRRNRPRGGPHRELCGRHRGRKSGRSHRPAG